MRCLASRQQEACKTCGSDAQDDKTLCADGMAERFIKVRFATSSPAVDEKKSALFIDDGIPDDFEDVSLVAI